jgi:hypothetical protein
MGGAKRGSVPARPRLVMSAALISSPGTDLSGYRQRNDQTRNAFRWCHHSAIHTAGVGERYSRSDVTIYQHEQNSLDTNPFTGVSYGQ